MALEFKTEILDAETAQARLDELAKEGWVGVPGYQPRIQAIFQLCREIGVTGATEASGAGVGRFTIDESKIGIMRNGKFIDNDGNEVPPPG